MKKLFVGTYDWEDAIKDFFVNGSRVVRNVKVIGKKKDDVPVKKK